MLKERRKLLKMTQKDLSEKTNISQSYISKLESDNFYHSPTLRQVLSLSRALKLNMLSVAEYLLLKEIKYEKEKINKNKQ